MSILDLCSAIPVTVSETSSLQEAARLMDECCVGCLVVFSTANGKSAYVGMITDRDIAVKAAAENKDMASTPVSELMTRGLLTIKETASILDALKQMEEHQVRRLVVVDDRNFPVGLVSTDDFIRFFGEGLAGLSGLFYRQTGTPGRHRVHEFSRMS